MRAETAADRRVFYATATWTVPIVAVLLPVVVLGLGLHLFVLAGGATALAVAVGGWLIVRHGRGSAAGLLVGVVLGFFAALVGFVALVGWQP